MLVSLLHKVSLLEIAAEGHVEGLVVELVKVSRACKPLLGGLKVATKRGAGREELAEIVELCAP